MKMLKQKHDKNPNICLFFLRKTLAQGRLVNDSGPSSGKSRGVLAHGIGTEQSIAYIN